MAHYVFRDTTAWAVEEPLPAEALKINGVWLDKAVPGYRTLFAAGRELMWHEVTSKKTGGQYGEAFLYSNIPTREIRVGFAIISKTPAEYRATFTTLMSYLKGENAELIFNDEKDKFFTGTLTGIEEPADGELNSSGVMTFLCTDPRKKSLFPIEAYGGLYEDGNQIIEIYNRGNIPCPIDYEVLMHSENGMVAFSCNGEELQYGYLDEVDGGTVEQSEVLFELDGADFFNSATLSISDTDLAGNTDFTKVATCTHATNWSLAPGDWLCPQSLTNSCGGWGVALKTVTIPADSGGVIGAENFELSCVGVFEGLASQTGVMRVSVSNDSTVMAYTHIVTNLRNSTNATVYMVAGGQRKEFRANTLNSGIAGRGKNCRIYIRKSGSTITIAFGPNSTTFEVPELATTKATKATICFGQWSGLTDQMSFMGVKDVMFRKDNVESYIDIPNRYQDGDLMEVKGSEGMMYLNGQPDADDEIIGSAYFPAQPGANTIVVSNSIWAEEAVTVKAVIREAWL